jgi:integrase
MGVRVREKKPGEWWIFINHHGKRWSKKVGPNPALAREVAKKAAARLVLGDFALDNTPPPALPSFKKCAEVWLALPHFTPSGNPWKESTLEAYRRNLEMHAYSALGTTPIDHVRRKQLKTFFDDLTISGLSRATISVIKASIGGVLSYAMDSEMIESNPLKDLSVPRGKRDLHIEPLTDEEAGRFLEQTTMFMDGYYYAHFLCMLRTGMRLGELKAVQWQDVDFAKRQIEVRRSIRRGRLTDTKNRTRRRVDMTAHLAETLQTWKTEQKKAAIQSGRPFLDTDYVFLSKRGDVLCETALANALRRCLRAGKLRQIRIHDLRHTYATIRLLRGHNIGDVSYQLGHSSISMTYDVYGHWVPGHFKSEVDELDQTRPNAPQAHLETQAV